MKIPATSDIINTNDDEAAQAAKSFFAVAHPDIGLRFIEKDPTDEMIGSYNDGLHGLLFIVIPESGTAKRELKLLSRRCRSQPVFAWKRLMDLERRGYAKFTFWPGTQPVFAYVESKLAFRKDR